MKSILKGLVSVTFREMSPFQIIDLAVKSGIDGIEWGADVHIKPGELEMATKVLDYSNLNKIKILSYASYYKAGTEDRKKFKGVLETAIKLQAPRIRVWAGNKNSNLFNQIEYIDLVEDLKRISILAQKYGIEIGIEFHNNSYTNTTLSTQYLFKSLTGTSIYSYWQPPLGSSVKQNLQTIRSLGKSIRMSHCFHWSFSENTRIMHPLYEGKTPWIEYLKALIQFTSIDAVSMEFVNGHLEKNFIEDVQIFKEIIEIFSSPFLNSTRQPYQSECPDKECEIN